VTGRLVASINEAVSAVVQVEALLMKVALSMLLGLAVLLALVVGVQAEGKEKTLKGTILCAKCELKEAKKCTNAIRVKEDDKDVVYYFDDKGGKEEYHKEICQGPKEGSVTGKVSEKNGKKYIKPNKDGVKFE
jgi:hypothetical protein